MGVWVYDPFCPIWVSSQPREVINETCGIYVCQKDVLPLLRSMLEVSVPLKHETLELEILGRSQGHGCLGNPLKRRILGVPTHHSQSLHKSRDPGVQKVTCTRQVSFHSIFCLKRLVCRHHIIVKYNRNRFFSVLSLTKKVFFVYCCEWLHGLKKRGSVPRNATDQSELTESPHERLCWVVLLQSKRGSVICLYLTCHWWKSHHWLLRNFSGFHWFHWIIMIIIALGSNILQKKTSLQTNKINSKPGFQICSGENLDSTGSS